MSDASTQSEDLSSLLEEDQVFKPTQETLDRALTKDYDALYKRSIDDIEGFWDEQAKDLMVWAKPWDKVLEWHNQPPVSAKWFVGAQCNITVSALDRHVEEGRGDKPALTWISEEINGKVEEKTFTYKDMLERVSQTANALTELGVKQGDVVTIYMAMTPELPIAMLACARIGAIHSVVFGGFAAPALRQRMEDSHSKTLITSDISYRRGKVINLKTIADEAIADLDFVEHVLIHRRTDVQLNEIDTDFDTIVNAASTKHDAVIVDSEAPLYRLYTSGTTGKPKGVVHVHGGYGVGISYTHKYCFDIREGDIYWCAADPGWVTGHSYIVYGPLINGVHSIMAEGALDYPDPGRWWSIIEKYKVNVFYFTPTGIRHLMRFGDDIPAKYDLSSLRVIGSVGEPINPEAWLWYHKNIGRGKTPIVDTWWQTETGMFMITTMPSIPTKPGSAGVPMPGIVADIMDRHGNPVAEDKGGFLVIKTPWPAMFRTIFGDQDRYDGYWKVIDTNPPVYTAGDVATRDADGYFRVMGRADDVMNVSGHRIGTADVESALVSHDAVAESAVIGKPDKVHGEIIKTFIILVEGHQPSDELANELKMHVRKELSPIAVPAEIEFVDSLPKTRSGKIMRRMLKAKELGMDPGDISTIED